MPEEVDDKWVQFGDGVFNNLDSPDFFVTHA